MIALDSTQSTAIASSPVGVCWLVEMDFTVGTQYLTTWPMSLTTGGQTYLGMGALMEVAALSEGPDSSADKLTLTLQLADLSWLALVMGNVEGYRAKPVRLKLQLLTATYQPWGAPVLRWAGAMNRVSVSRQSPGEDGGEQGGKIEMECSRSGMARARHYQGLRLTLAQQQQRYPTDTGLRYVRTLIGQPALWLSKAFQTI